MKIYLLSILLLVSTTWCQGQNSGDVEKIFNFIECDEEKETFTYFLKTGCQNNEIVLQSILLRHVGTSQEFKSKRAFIFTVSKGGDYKLSKGQGFWDDFAKKLTSEIDSLNKLKAEKRIRLLMLAKKDSLIQLTAKIPGFEKKRDNFWVALKGKKAELKTIEEAYEKAKVDYENGDLEPSKWSATEMRFFELKDETNFLKTSLKEMTKEVSEMRRSVVRLKNETGRYSEKYYHQSKSKSGN